MKETNVCCGERHESQFCPHCGARLRVQTPMQDLLAYCHKQVDTFALKTRMAADDKKRIAFEKTSAKWQGWAMAIMDTMSNNHGNATRVKKQQPQPKQRPQQQQIPKYAEEADSQDQ